MTGTSSLDSKVDSSGGDQWHPLHSGCTVLLVVAVWVVAVWVVSPVNSACSYSTA